MNKRIKEWLETHSAEEIVMMAAVIVSVLGLAAMVVLAIVALRNGGC